MSSTKRQHSLSTSPTPPRKQQRFQSLDSEASFTTNSVNIYIVQAKLEPPAVSELFSLVEAHNDRLNRTAGDDDGFTLELCSDVSCADVIITAVHMKKRLERHVDWNIAKQKAIVTPDWLRDSVKDNRLAPCMSYSALKELRDETASHCPDGGSAPSISPTLRLPSNEPHAASVEEPMGLVDTTSAKLKANYASRYACCRASPLVCPNQALLEELSVLERHRELQGLPFNALSYARAISVLKAYPHPITRENYQKEEVQNLPHLGGKIQSKIKEFIKNGFIKESMTIRESAEYNAMSAFFSVHSVGPATARKLYELGLRTIEDMERYYDVKLDDDTNVAQVTDEPIYTPNGKLVPRRKSKIPDVTIKVSLVLREEFATPIPRDEVEEIYRVVMAELDQIQPGCFGAIVGGYRRGKSFSNDVDIVFSHSDQRRGGDAVKGLCRKLTFRLHKRGLITHVMHLSGFHARDALRQGHWDTLEKALTVFKLPDNGERKRIHRRLDLIFASPDAYWTAVIGWSGSKMFERDLRLWAKVEKGMKFDSTGLTRRHDSKLFYPQSEKEVFDILGLEWVDPIMRNADV